MASLLQLRQGGRAEQLQTLSSCCAVIGSATMVVDASGLIMEPRLARELEVCALGLISSSLLIEISLCCRRRRSPRTNEQLQGDSARPTYQKSAQAIAWQVLLFAWPVLVMAIAMVLKGSTQGLGIVPRTFRGFVGIFFGCFVHLSWAHFGWNACGYLLLGLCVLHTLSAWDGHGVESFARASAFIALTSGFCVWCLARPALHAGASGVVFGYLGLLLAWQLRRRDVPLRSLLLVLGVVASYGGAALLAVSPELRLRGERRWLPQMSLYEACTSRTTSAEHHVFGFLSGLACALLFFPTQKGKRPNPKLFEDGNMKDGAHEEKDGSSGFG